LTVYIQCRATYLKGLTRFSIIQTCSKYLIVPVDITELRQREDCPQRSRARTSRLARQSINNPVFIGADLPGNLDIV
jgi:hypothetical protein